MRNLSDSLRFLASQLYSFVLAVVVAIAFRVMIGKVMDRLPQTDPDLLQLREYERAIDKWLSVSYNASPDPGKTLRRRTPSHGSRSYKIFNL